MISLKIEDTFVDLGANAQIPLEIKNNIFNLDQVEATFSYTFKIPANDTNSQVFGYAEFVPTSPSQEHFRDYEAILYFKGVLIEKGLFRLKSANRDYFEGYIKSKVGVLGKYKDVLIKNILGAKLVDFTDFYTDTDKYVFPIMRNKGTVYNQEEITYTAGVYTNNLKMEWKPMFKLFFVLEELLDSVNFKIQSPNWIAAQPQGLNEIIIHSVKKFTQNLYGLEQKPTKFPISQHLPKITFKEFLQAIRKTFGLVVIFDSKFNTVTIHSYNDILDLEYHRDWTKIARPNPSITKNDYQGFTFDWDRDQSDKVISEQPNDLADFTFRGEVEKKVNLPTAGQNNLNKYYLVRELNQLFEVVHHTADNIFFWQYLADAHYKHTFDDTVKQIIPKCSPINKSNAVFWENLPEASLRNNNGKLVINIPYTGYTTLFNANDIKGTNEIAFTYLALNYGQGGIKVEIILENSEYYPNEKRFEIVDLVNDPIQNNTIEANLPLDFVANEEDIKWKYIIYFDNFVLRSSIEEDERMRLAIYHGKQNVGFLYANDWASADNYSFGMNASEQLKHGDFALRWKGEEGLVDTFFSKYIDFLKNTKKVNYKINFDLIELLNFNPIRKYRIRDTDFFVEKISLTINNQGLQPANVDLLACTGLRNRFPTPLPIPIDTNVLVFYDTSSFGAEAIAKAKAYIKRYFDEFRILHPDWTGQLVEIEEPSETWLNWSRQYAKDIYGFKKVLCICFIDEVEPAYHGQTDARTTIPTPTFAQHYGSFLADYNDWFEYFRGIVYAIPTRDVNDPIWGVPIGKFYANMAMSILCSMKGTTVPLADIPPSIYGGSATLSLIATENQHDVLGPGLEAMGWTGKYDFAQGFDSLTYAEMKSDFDAILY